MKLILLGAPGAGKGTQAEKISEKYGIPSVSTGEILRAAIKDNTALGLEAKSYMDRGDLVPDATVIGIIKEYLSSDKCKKGFILDGFPRSIPQAEALDAMGVAIDAVLDIEVEDAKIVERMSGRRVCPVCGATHHIVYNPPKTEGVCDKCNGELVIRKDDAPETVLSRLETYHNITEPLKDYYSKRGNLVIVEGQEKVEDTTKLVFEALRRFE
ncbi:MAG: adenylate kinase [Ruminococcaceae bacterium]|nr:adenylate kinase [Oscillospiraceae bacterium]